MSKISLLTVPDDLDGNEQVVLVKEGVTRRAAVSGLVAASVAPHVQAAELAASTALASANFYGTSVHGNEALAIAAGEAATVIGGLFSVDDGAGNLIYRERTTGGSVEIGRAVTPQSLAVPDGSSNIGHNSDEPYALACTVRDVLNRTYSTRNYTLGRDGETDDWGVLQLILNVIRDNGGGTLEFEQAKFGISKALIGWSGVSMVGVVSNGGGLAGIEGGTWLVMLTDNASDASSIKCGVDYSNCSDFVVKNIGVKGRAPLLSAGAITTPENNTAGFYFRNCRDFKTEALVADKVTGQGAIYQTCYNATIDRPKAVRCWSYGLAITGSSTSVTVNSPIAWGCSGALLLLNMTNSTINSSSCDHSDDPDAFSGENGNSDPRNHIIYAAAVFGVTLNSPGVERSRSPWLYAEGVQMVINAPNIISMIADHEDYRFIEVRGTAPSHITINCPAGFNAGVDNQESTEQAIFIENPAIQKVYLSGRWRLGGFNSPDAYSNKGLVIAGETVVCDFSQRNLSVGQPLPFIKSHPSDICEVISESGVKKIRIDAMAGAGQRFILPMETSTGFVRIWAEGEYNSSFATGKLRIVDNLGAVLEQIDLANGNFAADKRFQVTAPPGRQLAFEILTNDISDVLNFSRLFVSWVSA